MTDLVVDSSALIAIMLGEPEEATFRAALSTCERPAMSAFSVLETSVAARRRVSVNADDDVSALLEHYGVEVVPFDAYHLAVARDVWGRYGKGRHPARLNLGDCCAYAAASVLGAPLLCKGDDFAQTDLPLVDW